ncbi:MAG TPA: hypothetical protein VF214_02990 [Edaphobacter sp.]
MELLERYLQAVGTYLPAQGRADTLAELRTNLLAQIEEREEAAGRPLTKDEIASVLELHGMPVMVAMRYRPQQSLIGPTLFPIYWYTLRRSLPLVLLAFAVVTALRLMAGGFTSATLQSAVWDLPGELLTFWAVLTLGFAAFEYAQGRYVAKLEPPKWTVRDLPPLQHGKKPPSLVSGVADLIVSVLMVAWLLAVPAHPYLMFGPGAKAIHQMQFTLTPDWQIAYWEIIALFVAMWPLKVMMMMPLLAHWRRALGMGVQLLGILPLVVLVTMPSFLVPAAALTAEQMKELDAINRGLHIAFMVPLAITVVKFIWCLGKWIIDEARGKQVGHVAVL